MGGGFGKIPVEMYSMDISMTAKVLYSYICNGAGLGQDEAGENTVSVSDLSAGINASHGATCNAIKELYEHGLIDIKKGRPCTYVVLDIFGCQWSNSDRQRSYNDRQKSNNDHQRSYNDRPYTLYKKNIKRNSKRILKEGGVRATRGEVTSILNAPAPSREYEDEEDRELMQALGLL